jgi:hypothetical protein
VTLPTGEKATHSMTQGARIRQYIVAHQHELGWSTSSKSAAAPMSSSTPAATVDASSEVMEKLQKQEVAINELRSQNDVLREELAKQGQATQQLLATLIQRVDTCQQLSAVSLLRELKQDQAGEIGSRKEAPSDNRSGEALTHDAAAHHSCNGQGTAAHRSSNGHAHHSCNGHGLPELTAHRAMPNGHVAPPSPLSPPLPPPSRLPPPTASPPRPCGLPQLTPLPPGSTLPTPLSGQHAPPTEASCAGAWSHAGGCARAEDRHAAVGACATPRIMASARARLREHQGADVAHEEALGAGPTAEEMLIGMMRERGHREAPPEQSRVRQQQPTEPIRVRQQQPTEPIRVRQQQPTELIGQQQGRAAEAEAVPEMGGMRRDQSAQCAAVRASSPQQARPTVTMASGPPEFFDLTS